MKQSDIIEIFCPDSFISVNGAPLAVDLSQIICCDGNFMLNNKAVRFSTLSCTKPPKDVARYTGNKCLGDHEEFEIGYKYKNDFLTLITGCFKKIHKITLYTLNTISKTIAGGKSAHPRKSSWKQGSFYSGVIVDNLYKRNNQRIAVNKQLGLNIGSTQYITEYDQKYYLSRGHLTPKADFIYGSQQDATFYFVNAIPQWNLLNIGNWKILENNLRKLASNRRIDLKIYTGTAEILSLPHNFDKRPVQLFLDERKILPIPKFIWKVVYHEASGRGVAFVGVNNPFLKEDVDEYSICKNVCDKLSDYIQINLNYTTHGYVYCCEVGNIMQTVSTIPRLNVIGLLT